MKKSIFGLFMCIVLISFSGVFCGSAIYDNTVFVCGKELSVGDYLAIGADMPSNSKPNGGYAYLSYSDDEGYILTLDSYVINSEAETPIYSNHDISVRIIGSNELSSLRGSLIQVNGNLTIYGEGAIELNCTTGSAVFVRNGSLTIESGTIICNGTDCGMYADNGSININGGNITTSGNSCAVDMFNGSLNIADSVSVIASVDQNGKNTTEYNSDHLSSYKYIRFTETVQLEGDINLDGELDMYDYILLKAYYFEKSDLTEKQVVLADLDNDNKISIFDYVILKSMVLSK